MTSNFTASDWDRYAQSYDVLLELRPYVYMLGDILEKLQNSDFPILDAGCGTGNLAHAVSQRGAEVIGVDASSPMLNRAKAKCHAVAFVRADLCGHVPFKAAAFGAVACVNTLYALVDPMKTLRAFHGLLSLRGKLVLVTPKRGYQNGLILKAHCGSEKIDGHWTNAHGSGARESSLIYEAVGDKALCARFQELARFNRRIGVERSFHFFTALELSGLVNACGFVDVTVSTTYADQNLLLTATKGTYHVDPYRNAG